VRVLGVPAVDGYPDLGRIELNLVAYLACRGGRATENQVIDAVWNGRAIERAALWNRISKARAALGRFIPARDQGANVVRLADGVTTDLDLFRASVERARRVSSAEAIELLRAAMSLVHGVPFDSPGYDWAHEQQHYADACELIERAALDLVDLALEDDDVPVAREAVSQALKALRIHEPLYRARMRIEARCGNDAGVRAAYNELAGLLDELDDGAGAFTPSAATTALLNDLVERSSRRTASCTEASGVSRAFAAEDPAVPALPRRHHARPQRRPRSDRPQQDERPVTEYRCSEHRWARRSTEHRARSRVRCRLCGK
jgi:DNA-binding SARP family transcriptional activator